MPRPPRHHRLAHHLARAALAALLLAPGLPALAPPVGAQDPAPSIPGLGDLPDGVTLNYAVGGPIGDVPAGSQLILERIEVDAGESVPGSDAAQILVAESGSLTLIDDLGLEATLAESQAFFADAGSASALRADSPTELLRAAMRSSSPPAVEVEITESGCSDNLTVTPGGALTVRNTTNRAMSFTIVELDVYRSILAQGDITIVAPDSEGSWTMACGPGQTATLTVITAVETEFRDGVALITGEVEAVIPSASLALISLTLDPGATLGPVTMAGPVGIYSGDSDLTVFRPNKLDATLPSERGVVFPTGMIATLANTTNQTGEVLVIAIVPSALVPESTATSTAADSAPIGVTVQVMDIYFEPANFSIESGATLVLDASGAAAPHNFEVQSLGIDIDIAPGEIKEVVIEGAPGTYDYICNVPGHKEAGMVGMMTIAEAGSATALEPLPVAYTIATVADKGFDPRELTIPANVEVTLTLDNTTGKSAHNLTIVDLMVDVDVAAGAKKDVKIVASVGRYGFFSAEGMDKLQGMLGVIQAVDAPAIGAAGAASAPITIAALDIYFDPAAVEIAANTPTTIIIDASGAAAPHNFAIDALGIDVDVAPGAKVEVEIDAPAGTYDFYCNVPGHREAGMVGALFVTPPVAGSATEATAVDPMAYLPDEAEVVDLGLLPLPISPANSIGDTLQMNLDQIAPSAAAAWESGLVASYFRVDEPNATYFVSVDVFTNETAAMTVIAPYLLQQGAVAGRTFIAENSFWDDAVILDKEIILRNKDTTGIVARHGRVVVSIINARASVYAAGFVPGLFEAIADPAVGRRPALPLAMVAPTPHWVEHAG